MKMLTTAAAVAAVLVSAGAAMAAPANAQHPANHDRGQYASNRNLAVARLEVDRALDRLQNDASDYGGHRERAMDDLQAARGDLADALSYYRNRHPNARPVPMGNDNDVDRSVVRGQRASNEDLTDVRQRIETAIDQLQRDRTDYGGFKEKAIDRLQAARAELDAAIDYRQHAGSVHPGQRSDTSLRVVREHVAVAIDNLQHDASDYGGHRVNAIADLQQAIADINAGLSYDASHDRFINTTTPVMPAQVVIPNVRGEVASNRNISMARQHIEAAIDALQRDSHDYGGYRVKAIGSLEAARNQLELALQFSKTR